LEHQAVVVAIAEDDRMSLFLAKTEGYKPHQLDLREERLYPEE